jgi:hypothetical protein
VDGIAKNCGDQARRLLLGPNPPLTRKEVEDLAKSRQRSNVRH